MPKCRRPQPAMLRTRLFLPVFAAVLCFTVATTADAQSRKRFDPLGAIERELALDYFARGEGVRDEMTRRRMKRDMRLGVGKRVLLLTERRPVDKSEPEASARQADVYVYDYRSDRLIHTVVDTRSRKVLKRNALRGVQLPLIEKEVVRAMAIVMRSDEHRRGLEAAYQRVTGATLDTLQQIDYKAFVFHANSIGDKGKGPSIKCGVRRCAQLLVYTLDNISLDYSPIVDLSRGRVTEVFIPDSGPNSTNGDHQHAH